MSNYADDWRDEYLDEKRECESCYQNEQDKDYAKALFQDLVKILYSKEDIPLFKLDEIMDELGAYLGERDIPKHLPPVVRMSKMGQEFHNITSDQVKSI